MKRYLAAAILVALTVVPAPSGAKVDKPPRVRSDPYAKTINISGAQHDHNALLDLNKTTWWLDADIVAGLPHNPTVIFNADIPSWAFIDGASDINGNPLRVVVLNRNLSELIVGDVNEQVFVELPIDYARAARQTGLNFKLFGKNNSFVVNVPAQSVDVFMATYEAEAAKVGGVPTMSPGTPEPPGQKIGIDFWPMPNGLMILRVASGSAAEKAGLQPSQLIEAINGTPMKGVTAPEAIKLIAGSVGVTLKIADVGDIKVR